MTSRTCGAPFCARSWHSVSLTLRLPFNFLRYRRVPHLPQSSVMRSAWRQLLRPHMEIKWFCIKEVPPCFLSHLLRVDTLGVIKLMIRANYWRTITQSALCWDFLKFHVYQRYKCTFLKSQRVVQVCAKLSNSLLFAPLIFPRGHHFQPSEEIIWVFIFTSLNTLRITFLFFSVWHYLLTSFFGWWQLSFYSLPGPSPHTSRYNFPLPQLPNITIL